MGAVVERHEPQQSQSQVQVQVQSSSQQKPKQKSQKKAQQKVDPNEVRAGQVGGALSAHGSPEAAEKHEALIVQMKAVESGKQALEAARLDAEAKKVEAKQVHKAFVDYLGLLPVIGAKIVGIKQPPPILTAFEEWDPDLRCEEHRGWLSADPNGVILGDWLSGLQKADKAAAQAAVDAEVRAKKTAQAYGGERLKLVMMTRECELFIRLHAAPDSDAYRAIIRPKPRKKKAEAAAPGNATDSPVPGQPAPTNVASGQPGSTTPAATTPAATPGHPEAEGTPFVSPTPTPQTTEVVAPVIG